MASIGTCDWTVGQDARASRTLDTGTPLEATDPLPAHQCTVLATLVVQRDDIPLNFDGGVLARHLGIVEENFASGGAADLERPFASQRNATGRNVVDIFGRAPRDFDGHDCCLWIRSRDRDAAQRAK